MYRPSDPQKPLFEAVRFLPPQKQARCEKTWAGAYRQHALPILRKVEDEFADLFDAQQGRPNRPVELVLGTLILKEISDLTDEEALYHLEFDVLWWWAMQRELHELHLCQKTLHNFRAGLMKHEKSKVAFRRVTDELIGALGVKVGKQRLDSTHVLSNIAVLTRLGLFCETIRVFLRGLKEVDGKAYAGLPEKLLERHGEESRYQDARKAEGPRRLEVVARDVGRLVERFEKDERVTATEGWKLLRRLYEEQCEVKRVPKEPGKDEDDHGDGAVGAELKEAKKVEGDSLQSPHDPDVTYSGHKGKGYSVQVMETSDSRNVAQMITEAEVTPACESDARSTVPMVKEVVKAGHAPREVAADTLFSGAENAAEVSKEGVNLLAPCPAVAKPEEGKRYGKPQRRCPKDFRKAGDWLSRQEASKTFNKRYAIRAGIEATNSELKRAHGLRKLRVRGEERVKLAVYLKALACNVKRALRAWMRAESALMPA